MERVPARDATTGVQARAIERVADRLGNTVTVCKKCYIHPSVLEAYEEGVPLPTAARGPRAYTALRAEERRAVALLLQWQATAGERTLPARLAASLKQRPVRRVAPPLRQAA